MVLYFMNTSIIPSNFEGIVTVKHMFEHEVKTFLNDVENRYTQVSAVGHESTAQIMSAKLGIEIKMNRLNVEAKSNDVFICFQLKNRGLEGKIYTLEEMESLECIWKIMYFSQNFCNCGCDYCGSD